jgi:gas vesicle protein
MDEGMGGRVNERSLVLAGAVVGALVGAAASFLFLTDRGRVLRDRMEPAVDDLRQEFMRFQRTVEKVGHMANEGMRVVSEFNTARANFSSGSTSH